jgi:hypothetical protein
MILLGVASVIVYGYHRALERTFGGVLR